MIALKNPRQIELMRAAGRVVAQAHHLARSLLRPGVTTGEVDAAVEDLFARRGATPLFKGVEIEGAAPFPAVTCISVNEQVVHGIPGDRKVREGDIVSIDTGCRLNGWCADAAWTYPVGRIDPLKQRLLEVGQETLWLAIEQLGHKRKWSQVAKLMARNVRRSGFHFVEEFVGHGIGREMHEDPQVPNFSDRGSRKHDFRLRPGLVLAIEPMVNAGTKEVYVLDDQWTVETEDLLPSAHFEHTVALTDDGPIVLTAGVGDPHARGWSHGVGGG